MNWVQGLVGGSVYQSAHEAALREIGVRFRLTLPNNTEWKRFADSLVASAGKDEEFFLDLIDALLDVFGPAHNEWAELDRTFGSGASVWRVGDDRTSLARVVSDEAQATFEAAVSVADDVTTELKEAWANAFGRNGDPSDAWDHAIKALEDLLIRVVVPNQTKPNLGHVVGQLGNQGAQWKLVLPGKNQDHDVAPLVGMLDLIWPNHDRHGGGQTPKRTPSAQEARAVVTLAATIVQWHREGWVVQRR
jgi:hypothetical protein